MSEQEMLDCERWLMFQLVEQWPYFDGFRFEIERVIHRGPLLSVSLFEHGRQYGGRVQFSWEPLMRREELFVRRQLLTFVRNLDRATERHVQA